MAIDLFSVVGVTAEDFRRAREIAREWSDQRFSIVDCTSFAVIERLDIGRAFAFDKHFRIVRFGWPRQRAWRSCRTEPAGTTSLRFARA